MPLSPKQEKIEHLLKAAGWSVEDHTGADIKKLLGLAVRDFPLARGYGQIDYLLYLEGKAVGLIEIDTQDNTLTGVPIVSEKYSRGLPFTLRLFIRPLPFLYQSRGSESCFTNTFDPHPKPRHLIGFHRPETLQTWLEDGMVGETPRDMAAEHFPEHRRRGRSFQERLMINMPKLERDGLSLEQHKAISNLETSLGQNHPRALLEMPDGTERTKAILHFIERLFKFAAARRVLLLVHSKEIVQKFEAAMNVHTTPNKDTPFVQSFPSQQLRNEIAPGVRLCITTLSQLYSLLSAQGQSDNKNRLFTSSPSPAIQYQTSLPIESFEVLILDDCNTAIVSDFQEALNYFDAYLIGLTEKTDQKTAVFFNQNRVMQYKETDESTADALSDGLNVIS